jgi:hypothetical protein
MPTKTTGSELFERLERVAARAYSTARDVVAWLEREIQSRAGAGRERRDSIPISEATLLGVAMAPPGVGVRLTPKQAAQARQIEEQALPCHPANTR